MNQKLVSKSLKLLCKDYIRRYGQSYSSLSLCKFDFLFFVENEIKFVVKEIDKDPNTEIMAWIVDELSSQGFLESSEAEFWLTKNGFDAGTESFASKFVNSLNKNPGVISFFALLISLTALYFSYTKL